MNRYEEYNKLDAENLTLLGRFIYPWAIRYRNQLALKHIPQESNDLLDFGGGYGYLIRHAHCLKAVSIDEKAILTINRDHQGNVVSEESAEGFLFVDKLPFDDECFDCITAVAILEHIKDIKKILQEFNRILRNGGTLIITTPTGIVNRILPFLDKGSSQLRGKKVTEEHEHCLGIEQMQQYVQNIFRLKLYKRFQFGINQLFIYEKKER